MVKEWEEKIHSTYKEDKWDEILKGDWCVVTLVNGLSTCVDSKAARASILLWYASTPRFQIHRIWNLKCFSVRCDSL